MTEAVTPPPEPQAKTIVQFNLNGYIYVKLTDAGKAWHATKHAMFLAQTGRSKDDVPYEEIHENVNGVSRWTAWEFMQVFGDQMFNGQPNPVCEMNILVDLKLP